MRQSKTATGGPVILAGDIGGTKTRLAMFQADGNRLRPLQQQMFQSRDYSGLGEILHEWLSRQPRSIRTACLGVAGPVVNGRCKVTYLPWTIDARQIGKVFGIPRVVLLNDLEAMAYGTLCLTDRDAFTLNPGRPQPEGNRCVIAAGTGLGEAMLIWDGRRYRPSASEGGHTDFAPRNPLERMLLEYLSRRFPRVSYQQVLSGPGLLNIYEFLKHAGQAKEPSWLANRIAREDPAAVIAETALAGTARLCVKTLDVFLSVYGAEAGNLALKTLATGGVYIGGGMASKILEGLRKGIFMEAFLHKTPLVSWMRRLPVLVILNEHTGLLGAARYGLQADA